MATAIKVGNGTGQQGRTRLIDGLQHWITRLFYAVLGAAGVLLWLLMQLPLGARAKNALVTTMIGCFGIFTLGWRVLGEQAAGRRRR